MHEISLEYLLYAVPVVLISFTVHEFTHAFVSDRLGDSLPSRQGRLTLNPLRHIDPIGFLCLLLFGFGWAKPVQVNTWAYEDQKNGPIWVAFSGPFSNLALAFISAFIVILTSKLGLFNIYFYLFMECMVSMNVGMFIFNLLPIPPLDGGYIWRGILSEDGYDKMMQNQAFLSIIMVVILVTPVLEGPLTGASEAIIGFLHIIADYILFFL